MKPRQRSTDRSRARSAPRATAVLGIAALVASTVTAVGMGGAAQAAPTAIVENGTFETGITGWSAPLGGTLSQTDLPVLPGMMEPPNDRPGIQPTVRFTIGPAF